MCIDIHSRFQFIAIDVYAAIAQLLGDWLCEQKIACSAIKSVAENV